MFSNLFLTFIPSIQISPYRREESPGPIPWTGEAGDTRILSCIIILVNIPQPPGQHEDTINYLNNTSSIPGYSI